MFFSFLNSVIKFRILFRRNNYAAFFKRRNVEEDEVKRNKKYDNIYNNWLMLLLTLHVARLLYS